MVAPINFGGPIDQAFIDELRIDASAHQAQVSDLEAKVLACRGDLSHCFSLSASVFVRYYWRLVLVRLESQI